MPLSPPGRQDFVLLTQSQYDKLRIHICSLIEPMSNEDLRDELEDLMMTTYLSPISMPILRPRASYLGHVVANFIIVSLDPQAQMSSDTNTVQMSKDSFCLLLDSNCNDIDVPGCGSGGYGVVVGQFGIYSRNTPLTTEHIEVLDSAFPSVGLNISCTDHEGKFLYVQQTTK
jgi:hypothetical protein